MPSQKSVAVSPKKHPSLWWTASLTALSIASFPASVAAQAIEPAPQPTDVADPSSPAEVQAVAQPAQGDEVIVTGFRRSLQSALNVKRQSVSSVDAIVAEDIAKFPDQNLAESLQRIPGISIQRDGGEGRAITVRGLGSQFTRVRLNGMETVATSTDGASANRDRAFDFNVFASELFTSIVVHKTAEASLDEGSLGAVVDLNTGNALGSKKGLTLVANAQAAYNDLSDTWGPRLSGLLAWKNEAGTFAVSASAAYQKMDTLELGNNTVRWEQARFDSVNGINCWSAPNSGGTFNPAAAGGACGEVGLAFHPRIPRYGEVGHDRERLGITANMQYAPTDRTKLSFDVLYSKFSEDRRERWGEVLFRSNQRRIDVVDYEIDGDNNLISGTFNEAWVRNEHYLRQSQTKFHQISGAWDQDVTDTFRFTLLGGASKSDANIPVETTIVFDNRSAQDYSFDYTNMQQPMLTFGTSMTDPANFQLAEIRDRPSNVTNKFSTAQLRTEWDVTDNIQLKLGAVYRRFDFDTEAYSRDTQVCGATGPDRVLGGPANGGVTCSATVYGFPVTGNLGELFELGDAGQPSGTTTEWLVPNLDASTAFTRLYDRTANPDAGNIRGVTEEVKGAYVQADVKGELAGLRYAANAGVRYARTNQSSYGLLSGVERTVKRDYADWLPAANLALYPTEELILRAAVAKVVTRPSLGSLTPGGSASGFAYTVNFGNPYLDPYRATNYDLGLEWYFAPESIFSVALFQKNVKSFVINETESGATFTQSGLPASVLLPSSPAVINGELDDPRWSITMPVNGVGAKLKGLEVGIQGPFRFLPGLLSNFGGIANATFVGSTATYRVLGPRIGYQANGNYAAVIAEDRKSTFFGLSKRAYNATLYYDDGKFSARGSLSYRSGFVDQNSASGNVFEGYNSTVNVDAAIRYIFNDHIELSLDGINLTDEYRDRWVDVDAKRGYEYNHFGRTFILGVRYKI